MRIFLLGLFLFGSFFAYAQFPERKSSSEIFHNLQKAASTGKVLYMAAHPDDENTRLISYFENKLHARTAYLSLTRGDGGQNLIGTEIGASIGILRTRELMAARAIDGGEQFFTRAVDFGYSKSADESFRKWGKENILRDAVWVIRNFRPDVIVTRFPPTNYAGHGHHEASAVVAEEAFDLAADPSAFPEQLEYVDTWQTKRLYFNTSTWWVKDLADRAKNSDDYLMANVGEYNPLIGETYAQIAARSRSEHKSQGFGSDYPMGNQMEYMKYVKGKKAEKGTDILSEVGTSWDDTPFPEVGQILSAAIQDYDFANPSEIVDDLVKALLIIQSSEENPSWEWKKRELENLLLDASGLEMEAACADGLYSPGSNISAEVKINSKSDKEVFLHSLTSREKRIEVNSAIEKYDFYYSEIDIALPSNEEFGNPYWLNSEYENLYEVLGYENLGKPENDLQIFVDTDIEIEGYRFNHKIQVVKKVVDPAKAVIYSPVYVVPEITARFDENTVVTSSDYGKEVLVTVMAHRDSLQGQLRPKLPKGWTCTPDIVKISLKAKGEIEKVRFTLVPESNPTRGEMSLSFTHDNASDFLPLKALEVIDYDHIPAQIRMTGSSVEIIPIDINLAGVKKIGYIEGPGDEVAKYLRSVSYDVTVISEDYLVSGDLSIFDAIVTGIRAFNRREDLAFANDKLNEYVANGGTWVVQYNTSRRIKSDEIGPYPFTISRERVTDETAPASFPFPDHPALNFPNKITERDFEGWVQERGLYFASEWDESFTPVISWADPEEPDRNGGLIVAPYGKGYFVYTGISFFRELPAGVSGAYRLMANILALSKSNDE